MADAVKHAESTEAGAASARSEESSAIVAVAAAPPVQVCYFTPDYTIVHPLQNAWTLWVDNPSQGRRGQDNWNENLKKVYTIKSVEDFWAVYNNIEGAETMAGGSNYHLFKEGVSPTWEDPKNVNGGKWVLPLPKNMRAKLNGMWLHTMMLLIGEQLGEHGVQVSGAVVSNRIKGDKLAIWTFDKDAAASCTHIGAKFREALEVPVTLQLGYQAHNEALKHGVSFNNPNMYTV